MDNFSGRLVVIKKERKAKERKIRVNRKKVGTAKKKKGNRKAKEKKNNLER